MPGMVVKAESEVMTMIVNKVSQKTGLSPGTLVHIGAKVAESLKMTVMEYQEGFFSEKEIAAVAEVAVNGKTTVTWLNMDGLNAQLIEQAGNLFGLHPLMLEDILNTSQRPKCDDYGDQLFLVAKMPKLDSKTDKVDLEQVSLVLGRNYLLSVQEDIGDVFNPVRERLRNSKGKFRKLGPDYLAYALMDTVVDNYFLILETWDSRIEQLEEELMVNPTQSTLRKIHRLKRELLFLRRAIWPLREAISAMERNDSDLIKESTEIYIRDLYDHTIRIIETVETFQEMLSGMLDIYLSNVSNKMNEVMKVLTVISTIFIPLTFLAGIYGMNFKYMPELNWRGSYFVLLAVMLGLALWMIRYFRRKKWL
jgi:magnesium transporter